MAELVGDRNTDEMLSRSEPTLSSVTLAPAGQNCTIWDTAATPLLLGHFMNWAHSRRPVLAMPRTRDLAPLE